MAPVLLSVNHLFFFRVIFINVSSRQSRPVPQVHGTMQRLAPHSARLSHIEDSHIDVIASFRLKVGLMAHFNQSRVVLSGQEAIQVYSEYRASDFSYTRLITDGMPSKPAQPPSKHWITSNKSVQATSTIANQYHCTRFRSSYHHCLKVLG
jgi:hypothetical protein